MPCKKKCFLHVFLANDSVGNRPCRTLPSRSAWISDEIHTWYFRVFDSPYCRGQGGCSQCSPAALISQQKAIIFWNLHFAAPARSQEVKGRVVDLSNSKPGNTMRSVWGGERSGTGPQQGWLEHKVFWTTLTGDNPPCIFSATGKNLLARCDFESTSILTCRVQYPDNRPVG